VPEVETLTEEAKSWSMKEVAISWEGKARMVEVLYRIHGDTI
jgi:hypothetical protein